MTEASAERAAGDGTISANLAHLRRHRGLSLRALAGLLDEVGQPIGADGLNRIEKGRRRVTTEELVALARALAVSPNQLLSDASGTTQAGDPLTTDEHQVMELTSQLWSALCSVTGDGRTRTEDLHEAALHIHALQNMVLAQAAARAYPDRYRLLGHTIEVPREMANE